MMKMGCLSLALFPSALLANPGAAQSGNLSGVDMPGMEGVATTVLGLVFILGLIFAIAWVFKRVGHWPAGGKGPIRIVGGVSLGARERVVVVEVEDARLVLGIAPGRVQTLHVLPPGSDFARSLDAAGGNPG
jgi:flagellar protein FliO/FliZ